MAYCSEDDALAARHHLTAGCETMERLLLGLLDSKGRIADQVHAIRKQGKTLRGGLALFRLNQSAGRSIQAINHLLAEPRDAVARARTWHHLDWNADPAVAAAITALIDQQTHSASRRPPRAAVSWCVNHVTAARDELLALPSAMLADTVTTGLHKLERKTYRRCRKLERRAAADFHRARKALKAWLGAAACLPATAYQPDPNLEPLAALLGDENDLATLAAWLTHHGFTRQFAPSLWSTLTSSRHHLQQQALHCARHLPRRHLSAP